MNYEKYIVLRGQDFFFSKASNKTLQAIANELGGNSSYDFEQQKATFMFSKEILMEINKLDYCHEITNALGTHFGIKYGCDFIASELYLRMTEHQTKNFDIDGIDLIKTSSTFTNNIKEYL